jgi:hypothetical protein
MKKEQWISDPGIALVMHNKQGYTAAIFIAVVENGEIQDWRVSQSRPFRYAQTARRFIQRHLKTGAI